MDSLLLLLLGVAWVPLALLGALVFGVGVVAATSAKRAAAAAPYVPTGRATSTNGDNGRAALAAVATRYNGNGNGHNGRVFSAPSIKQAPTAELEDIERIQAVIDAAEHPPPTLSKAEPATTTTRTKDPFPVTTLRRTLTR